MQTYELYAPEFLNPAWFEDVRGGAHDAVVDETGGIVLRGESLVFAHQPAPLPAGTAVKVWLGRNFYCCTLADWTEREVQRCQARETEARLRAHALDARRDEANAFNARIALPVAWTVGQKDVLSGLSARSMGDGRNRRSVNHILLEAPLALGRLRRQAGDFLCTSRSGSNGRRWASSLALEVDGQGASYAPRVTCAQCLKRVAPWMNQ